MTNRRTKISSAPDMKVEHGIISGYASTWDNTDLQGDIVRRGAFTKTINERVAAGKVALMVIHMGHGGDTVETIGLINKAVEDETGLFIEAPLFDAQIAQETRQKVLDAPNLFGLSIGYRTITGKVIMDSQGNDTGGEEILEAALFEVTVTAQPANIETSAAAKTGYESFRKELEQVKADLAVLKNASAIQGTPLDTSVIADAAEHATLNEIARQKRVILCLEKTDEGATG